jgi:hypothetical protein
VKHTEHATQATKQYMGDYTAKAQALIKGSRHHDEQPQQKPSVKATDFPAAPREDVKPDFPVVPNEEPKPTIIEPTLDSAAAPSDKPEEPLIVA